MRPIDSSPGSSPGSSDEDTLELHLPSELPQVAEVRARIAEEHGQAHAVGADAGADAGTPDTGPHPRPGAADLLDSLADWGPTATRAGVLQLVPVRVHRDLPLITRWMNDPAVAAFWGLDGPGEITADHLRRRFAADGRSVPCLGVLDGTPMSYWEVYRADLDPLARHYPARPHDTALHLLIGAVGDRGRGIGSTLLRAAADLVLDHRPACTRVVAEPDLRNTPCVAAFLGAGFRFAAELDLPGKRAALMIRERSLRHLL
ncbi:GNAT family N-acetyltransferase [Streptomyces sp. URMC 123]|uniref:GNAT family N-acetyltransferase n=1 Tax=Streptomyces sp. URMC 123 TaxID=3423403 RepID=UPI003F1A46F3